MSPNQLPLTGERTVPGIPGERYWFHRHEAAYAWVVRTQLRPGDVVIEAGAGEGYGAGLLQASGAAQVLALDYDALTAEHVAAAYPDVTSVRANLVALPVADSSADLVVSMQVVEHLWDVRGFLAECRRALHAGGRLVLTTPNRPVFSPGLLRGAKPLNPFHVQEFDAEQLADIVTGCGFADVRVRGLHHAERLAAFEAAHGPLVPTLVTLDVHDMSNWPPDVADLVYGCSAADFVVGHSVDSHDLVLTAVRA